MGIHTRVIKLNEDFTTLDDLHGTILLNNNNKLVAKLTTEERSRYPKPDITLYSTWEERPGIESDIQEINFYQNVVPPVETGAGNIRFLVKRASVEYTKHTTRINGVLLGKNLRTNHIDIDVIFFETNNEVYVIICTIPNHENKVLDLINKDNISLENHDYIINPNEFLWLFYRYSTDNKMLNEFLKITNITSFTGNISNEQHVIKGDSDVTSTLIVTKAFVSTGHPFTKMEVEMQIHGYGLVFLIDKNSNLTISPSSTFLTQQDVLITLPLYIVSILLPLIQFLYTEDGFENDVHVQEEFKRLIGKDVISEIMAHNSIDKNDL